MVATLGVLLVLILGVVGVVVGGDFDSYGNANFGDRGGCWW